MAWNDDLVGPALNIAASDHTPLRVVAGPGTGKTFAVKRRVARLLEEGAAPERILVCTFTRTAAADLRKEINGLGITGADSVRAGTLHALCFSILSRNDVLDITGRTPRPLLAFEERFMLEDIDGEGFGGIRDRRRRVQAFNAAWARLQTEEPGWPRDPVDHSFQQMLLGWLRFHKAMLIGELCPETLKYLRDNPNVDARQAFEHVLVDEYQDLNRAEQALLDVLASQGLLLVVGDEDQSIYSFKYAHPEGIATFPDTHTNTHDESLNTCRRCPRLIVELANHLITQNAHRSSRVLTCLAGNPDGEIHVVQWPTVEDEAIGIAQFVQARLKAGTPAGQTLVLTPRRQFGYAIRDALSGIGVPAHSFFHEQALDGDPTKPDESKGQQVFSLLSLLANPADRVALRCWCGYGSPSLRSTAWQRLRAHCESTGAAPWEALQQLRAGALKLPRTGELVARFRELEQRLAVLSETKGLVLVDALFPEAEEWAQPLRDLALSLSVEDAEPSDLFESLRTGITQPELPTDVDYVRVMSLHKSKGLTADLVVVAGCLEGLVPLIDPDLPPVEQDRILEEQRRLFYVAITRATKVMVLSSVSFLPTALAFRIGARVGGHSGRKNVRTVASRFLRELGPTRPDAVTGAQFLKQCGVS